MCVHLNVKAPVMPVPAQEPQSIWETAEHVFTLLCGSFAIYFGDKVRRMKKRPVDPDDDKPIEIDFTALAYGDLRREIHSTRRESEEKSRREMKEIVDRLESIISQLTTDHDKARMALQESVMDIRDEVRHVHQELASERRKVRDFMRLADPESFRAIGGD